MTSRTQSLLIVAAALTMALAPKFASPAAAAGQKNVSVSH